jgi:hypothetical protein
MDKTVEKIVIIIDTVQYVEWIERIMLRFSDKIADKIIQKESVRDKIFSRSQVMDMLNQK